MILSDVLYHFGRFWKLFIQFDELSISYYNSILGIPQFNTASVQSHPVTLTTRPTPDRRYSVLSLNMPATYYYYRTDNHTSIYTVRQISISRPALRSPSSAAAATTYPHLVHPSMRREKKEIPFYPSSSSSPFFFHSLTPPSLSLLPS